MDFNSFNLCGGCMPAQIINLNFAFNNLDGLKIYDKCDVPYDLNTLMFAYSVDSVCWSCWMSYSDILRNTIEMNNDYYAKVKVQGDVSRITIDDEPYYNYSTQLDSEFSFSYCDSNPNIYSPYNNMEGAINLYQNLSNTVSCITGIPIYYFKLSPNAGSSDLTFKEYALMDVESVKQIKIIINENQMPSSKPEFSDFGLEWQTDWETEIPKGLFATAFGPTAQPTEGDLIYIPMMKRMWMVNEAYEEKRDSFMWIATTFKVTLVKYQEKDSVDLNDTETMVNSFVKNKYEDIFGEDEDTMGSGEEFNDAPLYAANSLYPIYESDSQRKYVSCEGINITDESTHFKGTVISDKMYKFDNMSLQRKIVYQRPFCGENATISFVIKPEPWYNDYDGALLSIGRFKIKIHQENNMTYLSLNKSEKIQIQLENNTTYFVFIRWSKELNVVEMSAAKYVWPEAVPIYKLNSSHYWYDIDNMMTSTDKYTVEFNIDKKTEVMLEGFYGKITNIKLYDIYNDNISEILMMYPTNNRLLINDTARNIIGMSGHVLS